MSGWAILFFLLFYIRLGRVAEAIEELHHDLQDLINDEDHVDHDEE